MLDTAYIPFPNTEAAKGASAPIRAILDRALEGREISEGEAIALFRAEGADLDALLKTADAVRRRDAGDAVSFIVNRNINFTNVCYMGCRFCGFAKRREEKGAEFLPLEKIARRAREAWDRDATEVCIQGGLHPDIPGHHYRDILKAVKAEVPAMHIHAFSPFEIWYGARKSRLSYEDFLIDLKESGLGSVPGTAAEILDTEVRRVLTRNKLSAEAWVEIISTAHRVGLPTTATIMYGHVDGPRHWAEHIGLLRAMQRDTGGFTELVPLGFVHSDSPLFLENPAVRPGASEAENLRMHAVARLMLAGFIDNIQVSWVKLGPAMAMRMLACGVNDLGGTLMNESISRAAGSTHGQEVTPAEMAALIRSADRIPVRRNTLYETLGIYDDHAPAEQAPLVARAGASPVAFLGSEPVS